MFSNDICINKIIQHHSIDETKTILHIHTKAMIVIRHKTIVFPAYFLCSLISSCPFPQIHHAAVWSVSQTFNYAIQIDLDYPALPTVRNYPASNTTSQTAAVQINMFVCYYAFAIRYRVSTEWNLSLNGTLCICQTCIFRLMYCKVLNKFSQFILCEFVVMVCWLSGCLRLAGWLAGGFGG